MMNEELSKKLLSYIEKLEGGIDAAVEFSAEQTPLVIQEYLAFGFIDAIVPAVLFGVVAIVMWIAAVCVSRSRKIDDDVNRLMATVFLLTMSSFPAVGAYSAAMVAVKIHMAPRVYLIEQISNLLD